MNKKDVLTVMEFLSKREHNQGLFVSEADFQFQFGLALRDKFDYVKDLLFEYPVTLNKNNKKIDLVVLTKDGKKIPIEFKYFKEKFKDPKYWFMTKQNDTWRCFDYFKDIETVEAFLEAEKMEKGFAIILTGVKAYWNGPQSKTNNMNYSLKDGRQINPGRYEWTDYDNAVLKAKRYKDQPEIKGTYVFKWEDYKKADDLGEERKFKYMVNEI